jgi:hypothetical protein
MRSIMSVEKTHQRMKRCLQNIERIVRNVFWLEQSTNTLRESFEQCQATLLYFQSQACLCKSGSGLFSLLLSQHTSGHIDKSQE